MYFVYILECDDETLYTGIAVDLEKRLVEHKSGKGAKYTRSHGAKRIVYVEEMQNRSEAQKRESEIKKLSRAGKLRLIKQFGSVKT